MIRWMKLFCMGLLYGPDAPMEYAEEVLDKRSLKEERRIMRKAGLDDEKIEIILEGEAEARAEMRARVKAPGNDRGSGKALGGKLGVSMSYGPGGYSDKDDESYYGL